MYRHTEFKRAYDPNTLRAASGLQPVDAPRLAASGLRLAASGAELEACSRLAASVLHPRACRARVHSCVQVHVERGFAQSV